jgi:KDO2-lipid IV(A) lauroyltransferase
LTLAYHGLKAQVLTYGQPSGGYKIQNQIRSETGLDITPVDENTHDQAVSRLRNGGLVITAVDRPIRKKAHMLDFFQRPSPLPVGHIRMSLEAGVPIIVASASLKKNDKYYIQLSEPIHMIKHADSEQEIKVNGEAVLIEIERHIRDNPGQWLMYYPVWSGVNIE